MDTFLQQLVNGLTAGSVYAVVALGYTMVYGIIQLINFAHGEVVMIGAMVAFTVINALAPGGLPPLAVVLVGTACAIPVCMLVGYSMERLSYRPLRSAPRLAPLITAIGVSILGLKAFSAAMLGGIGNIPGAMLGGVLLGLVEALGAGYIGVLSDLCAYGWIADLMGEQRDGGHFILFGSNYQDVFAFLVLIVVLVFRPSGLLGERVGDRA